jgi:O-antigen ligase
LHLPQLAKVAIIGAVIVLGLSGFALKYFGYFKRGATSVEARMDYWKAATQNALDHPLLGSGPGTFQIAYSKLKAPDAEMARLAHNDYLQQASDSGIIGLLAFSGLIFGSLWFLYRKSSSTCHFSVWLSLAGVALQSFSEFHLYIPGLAWPFFMLLGWLWGVSSNQIDKPAPTT